MDAEENQKQVFPRRPQPLEIAARFPHSHRRDEAVEVENQKQVFPLSTATGWLFRPNSERRPGGGASLLLQAHCSIRKCFGGVIAVIAHENLVSPSGVGYDIGCGNKAVLTDADPGDVRRNIATIMDEVWN